MNETTVRPPLNVKIKNMPVWVESYPLNVAYRRKRKQSPSDLYKLLGAKL